jgi:hypothetical protein
MACHSFQLIYTGDAIADARFSALISINMLMNCRLQPVACLVT